MSGKVAAERTSADCKEKQTGCKDSLENVPELEQKFDIRHSEDSKTVNLTLGPDRKPAQMKSVDKPEAFLDKVMIVHKNSNRLEDETAHYVDDVTSNSELG